jgi:hypothetical protein
MLSRGEAQGAALMFCTQCGEQAARGAVYCAYCGAKMLVAEAEMPRDAPRRGLTEGRLRDLVLGEERAPDRLGDRGLSRDPPALRSWASVAGKVLILSVVLLVGVGLLWWWFQRDAYCDIEQSCWLEWGMDEERAMRIVDGTARALGIGLGAVAAASLCAWVSMRLALRSAGRGSA